MKIICGLFLILSFAVNSSRVLGETALSGGYLKSFAVSAGDFASYTQSQCLSSKTKETDKFLNVSVKNKCKKSMDIEICAPIKLTGRYSCDIQLSIKPGKTAKHSYYIPDLVNKNYKYFGREAYTMTNFPDPNSLQLRLGASIMKLPKARTKDIVIQHIGEETLAYDLTTHQAFQLNETAANVFNACNGETSFDDLKRKYKLTDDLIHLALDELKTNNLIEGYQSNHFDGLSRREVIKRVGLTSMMALPVIIGITAPTAAQAQSSCISSNSSFQVASGTNCSAYSANCLAQASSRCCSGRPTSASCSNGSTFSTCTCA